MALKATPRDVLVQLLALRYPGMLLKTTEQFDGSEGGIWTSAEDGLEAKDGFKLFNYYTEDFKKYNLGVHVDLAEWLEGNGWYAEWCDPGTVMIWPE